MQEHAGASTLVTPTPSTGTARGAQPSAVRAHNLHVVLDCIVHAEPPASRAEIAALTGLGKGTVTALVDTLLRARLIRELAPVASTAVGRPSVPLAPARATYVGLGIELAPDGVSVRAIDLAGGLIAHTTLDLDLAGSAISGGIETIRQAVTQVVDVSTEDGALVAGACVAVPAVVDEKGQILRSDSLRRWEGISLPAALRSADAIGDYPLHVGASASLAATAEAALARSEHQPEQFIHVYGGLSIGASIVGDASVRPDVYGGLRELGHISIDPRGRPCPCGRRGCLRQYASLPALWSAAGQRGEPDGSVLLSLLESGHRATHHAVDDAGRAIARALAAPLGLLGLREVVLDGWFAHIVPFVRDGMRHEFAELLGADPILIRGSLSGRWSVVIGAAQFALNDVFQDPGRIISDSGDEGS